MFETPIIINNFNRLTTTRRLADDLSKMGYKRIIILDNSSTYPPLLEWYETCPYEIKRFNVNYGELALYNSGFISNFVGWVVYTDSDIQLNHKTPVDFIQRMQELGDRYNINKVGLALRIDDLADDIDYRINVRNWESRYWQHEVEKDIYMSEVDTTFCILRAGLPFQYEALRIAGDFTAYHIPWYTNFSSLDEEETYYMKHASDRSNYRKIYDQWKEKQLTS